MGLDINNNDPLRKIPFSVCHRLWALSHEGPGKTDKERNKNGFMLYHYRDMVGVAIMIREGVGDRKLWTRIARENRMITEEQHNIIHDWLDKNVGNQIFTGDKLVDLYQSLCRCITDAEQLV